MAHEQGRADAWLRRHKVHNLELTPLVVARLAVRDRWELIEKRTYLGLIGIFGVGWVVEGAAYGWGEPDPVPALNPIMISAGYVLLTAVAGTMFWLQRRADERIARRLRRRVTRSEAAGPAAILGGHNLRLLAITYGGGVLVGPGLPRWLPSLRTGRWPWRSPSP